MVVVKTSYEDMFEKSKYIWINGEFVEWDKARVHIASHALHYGSGVFEGIRAYRTHDGRTAVFRLREHIERFFDSTKVYMMDIEEDAGFTQEQIVDAVKETIRRNELEQCYIRPLAFRDYIEEGDRWGYLGVSPIKNKVSVAIITFKWKMYLAPKLKLLTVPYRRPPLDALPMLSKATGHYLNSQLARMYVDIIQQHFKRSGVLKEDEALEALMIDSRGYVSEGSGENVFIVKKGKLYTPPLTASILRGITRESIIELAKDLGYTVIERDISISEVYTADECFMTGTAAEIKPILEVDFRKIGNGDIGPITRVLQEKFREIVTGKLKEYEKWLEYV